MVDISTPKQYTRGESAEYVLDRVLPKNTAQIIIEIDREITESRGLYTARMLLEIFTSDDQEKWTAQDYGGCAGGVIKDPSNEQRDAPVTAVSLGGIGKYQGKYLKVRVTSAAAQPLKPPRIMIGLG